LITATDSSRSAFHARNCAATSPRCVKLRRTVGERFAFDESRPRGPRLSKELAGAGEPEKGCGSQIGAQRDGKHCRKWRVKEARHTTKRKETYHYARPSSPTHDEKSQQQIPTNEKWPADQRDDPIRGRDSCGELHRVTISDNGMRAFCEEVTAAATQIVEKVTRDMNDSDRHQKPENNSNRSGRVPENYRKGARQLRVIGVAATGVDYPDNVTCS